MTRYLDSKEIKPVNPKEINPEYSLEELTLKLKLHYFGHLMRRASSLEKTLMLRKIEGKSRGGGRWWDGWIASPTQWTWIWANSGRCGGHRSQAGYSPWGHRVEHNSVTEQWQKVFYQLAEIQGRCHAPTLITSSFHLLGKLTSSFSIKLTNHLPFVTSKCHLLNLVPMGKSIPTLPCFRSILFVHSFVQLFSCIWLFAAPWTAACQDSLFFTISQS